MADRNFEIRVTHGGKVIESIFRGSITPDCWVSAFDEMINHDGGNSFRNAKYQVIDYSQGTLDSVTGVDVKGTAIDLAQRAYAINPDSVVITIVPGDLEYGLSRMFEGHAQQIPWKMYSIRSRDELENLLVF